MSEQIAGRWRHKKSGALYVVYGIATGHNFGKEWVPTVVYRSEALGILYARPVSEWHVRFEFVGESHRIEPVRVVDGTTWIDFQVPHVQKALEQFKATPTPENMRALKSLMRDLSRTFNESQL